MELTLDERKFLLLESEIGSAMSGADKAEDDAIKLRRRGDDLWSEMAAIPARTPVGRAAKVRTVIAHFAPDEWRGPDIDDFWIRTARGLLVEFAEMSEAELTAT